MSEKSCPIGDAHGPAAVQVHLLAISHGMWGTTTHFDSLVAILKARGAVEHRPGESFIEGLSEKAESHHTDTPTHLVIYRTHTNPGYFTYDGVDVCGTRVSGEIIEEIDALEAMGICVTKISLAGYSMGGMIMRYAAGVLYNKGVFERIKPVTFTTFMSPHVGVNVLGTSRKSYLFNLIGSWSMARTSRQVFLRDKYHVRGIPLFVHMTEEGSPYYEALRRFQKRALYANIVNDSRCEYYTSAIEPVDPFIDRAQLVSGPYSGNYGPVVLEGVRAIFRDNIPSPLLRPKQPLSARVLRAMKTIFRTGIVIPLWFGAFLINAGYQAVTSFFRVYNIIRTQRHLVPFQQSTIEHFLNTNANKMVEDLYAALDEQGPERLDLTADMKNIVARLNALGWEKHPVHITATTNAHSAAIARNPDDPTHWEGNLVIAHWAEEVLKLERIAKPKV